MSDPKENERRRQDRADLVNAFTRTAWQPKSQPKSQPKVGPRVLAGGAASILVAGAAFGLGAMVSYRHKQAVADHSRQLALAAQNDRTAPSVQLTGPASQITGHPGAPSPAPSAPGNAGRQPVVPRRITSGTNGPKVKTTPSASTPPPVTGRHRPPASPRADAGVNAAGSSGGKAPTAGGRDAYRPIQAESFSQRSKYLGTEDTNDAGGGQNIAWIGNGDWALYTRIDFGSTAAKRFYARIASNEASGAGQVEVRLDDAGSGPVATLSSTNTGGWQNWRTVSAGISGVTGVHDVYLTFTSGQSSDFINMNWFDFGH